MPVVSVELQLHQSQTDGPRLTECAAVFPGLVESIDAKDYSNAVRWARIIESCITTATANIKVGHHG